MGAGPRDAARQRDADRVLREGGQVKPMWRWQVDDGLWFPNPGAFDPCEEPDTFLFVGDKVVKLTKLLESGRHPIRCRKYTESEGLTPVPGRCSGADFVASLQLNPLHVSLFLCVNCFFCNPFPLAVFV